MNVPFFNYKKAFTQYRSEFHEALDKIIDNGQFIFGDELLKFEQNIESFVNAKHCVGVGNATDALEMMMSYIDLKSEDEVILASHTMIATLSAIVQGGGKPVPVDISHDGSINFNSIKENINKNTKALIVTQLNGHTCKMDEIINICDENNIYLFEDSAQALGSKFNDQFAGTFGLAGCYSFYPAKVLGGPGDGGALITNNEDFYNWSISYRDHGRSGNDINCIGRNSRLDNLMSYFLNIQFKDFQKSIARRRYIANLYNNGLEDIEELELPHHYNDSIEHYETFQNYEILCHKRDELKEYLYSHNIGTLIQWGGITINNVMSYGRNSKSTFSETKKYYNRCLMLPINTHINDEEVNFVIRNIRNFYHKK